MGTCPHLVTLYNRGSIARLCVPTYKCYQVRAQCERYPRFRVQGLGLVGLGIELGVWGLGSSDEGSGLLTQNFLA